MKCVLKEECNHNLNAAATDPDFGVHDMYDAISRKEYPYWTLYVQVMTYEQARTWEFNPFDLTKVSEW